MQSVASLVPASRGNVMKTTARPVCAVSNLRWIIRGEHGYYWELLKGAAEAAGGILIYLSPIKGAAAMTLAVAIVLLAQGIGQIGCGIKIKPQGGWLTLALAGVASLLIGAMLIFK